MPTDASTYCWQALYTECVVRVGLPIGVSDNMLRPARAQSSLGLMCGASDGHLLLLRLPLSFRFIFFSSDGCAFLQHLPPHGRAVLLIEAQHAQHAQHAQLQQHKIEHHAILPIHPPTAHPRPLSSGPWAGLQLVRCGPATELQPRLPHGLHCQLSSKFVRVTRTVYCSSFLPSSLDGARVGLHLLGSGHCRRRTEFGA